MENKKAIGFILLFPLYLYVIPRFANFGIYLLLKYTQYYKRYDSFRNLLKFDLFIIEFCFGCMAFKRFLIDNIKRFKEHLQIIFLFYYNWYCNDLWNFNCC